MLPKLHQEKNLSSLETLLTLLSFLMKQLLPFLVLVYFLRLRFSLYFIQILNCVQNN